jgi:hypothetical protein
MRKVPRHAPSNSAKRNKMSLKRIFALLAFVFLMNSSVMSLRPAIAEGQQSARIFADPPVVQSTGAGQNFTVNINVSDVEGLFGWQTGITFDPKVLQCTGFYEGEFLRRPGGPTVFVKDYLDMNNTLGIVYYRGCSLLGPMSGVNGSGQLAYATFSSVGIGVSDVHLTDIELVNETSEDIPFEAVESFTVPVNGTNYGVEIANNLTGVTAPDNPPVSGVFNATFSAQNKTIRFDALATEDWFCQVSVPKQLLKSAALSDWTVKVDGAPVYYNVTENATYTALYFGRDKGNHNVEITGTELSLGNPRNLAPPPLLVLVAASLGLVTLAVAIVDIRKTRSYKTRDESAMHKNETTVLLFVIASLLAFGSPDFGATPVGAPVRGCA